MFKDEERKCDVMSQKAFVVMEHLNRLQRFDGC